MRGLALDWWCLGAVAAATAVFAAPQVLSGQATFAGYTVLGDTSIHMIGADALLRLGRDFSSLPPSSYEYSLVQYFSASGYPTGGPTAAGVLTSIVHLDVAWTFQCFLTLLAAGLAFSLWTPDRAGPRGSRPLRALVVFLAAQPALVVAYVLQGSVKEIGTAFAVTAVAALDRAVRRLARGRRAARDPARGGVGRSARHRGADVPALARPAAARRADRRRGLRTRPALARAARRGRRVSRPSRSPAPCSRCSSSRSTRMPRAGRHVQREFGNLLGPLSNLQALGIWIVGDYRLHPVGGDWTLTRMLARAGGGRDRLSASCG